MQVVLNDKIVSYMSQGKGESILILHGWGDNSNNWQPFANDLAENYLVITVDLPGFGNSDTPPEPWGLSDYARFVGSFLNKIGITPTYIIGHSNGGAIAIRAIAQQILSPEKLILIASAGIRNEYNGRTKALRVLTKGGKFLSTPLPTSIKKHLRQKVYTSIGSEMLVVEHMQQTFKKIVEDDVREDASQLEVPVLLVYGDEDQQTPLRYAQIFHELIIGSDLEVIAGGDHFIYKDRHNEVMRAVKGFIA